MPAVRCFPPSAGPLVVGGFVAATIWAVLWGICVSTQMVPQQSRLVTRYLGIALGGALGGLLQDRVTPARPGLVPAGVSVVALLLNLATIRPAPVLSVAEPTG